MKYNIKQIIPIGIIAVLFTTSSCTDGYNDFNRNPYGVNKEEMDRDAYILAAAMNNLQQWVIPTNPNAFQFTECLLGGSYGGYLSDSNPGFAGKNFAQFCPANDWNRVMFNDIIPKMFIYGNEVKQLTDNEVIRSVVQITMIAGLHRVTDCYGPIPYTKVGADGKITAPYDSQEKVYKLMIAQLDTAITKLTKNRTAEFSANADGVYGGNAEKWIKFGNSLKLRLAMRMVNVEPELAKKAAEEAVANEVGVITSNADNAMLNISTTNPFFIITKEWNGGDSRVSADITSYMNGYSDPRRSAMFKLSTFETDNGYYGLRSGIDIPDGKTCHAYCDMNVKKEDKILWMNAAEVAFLRAEGALRGWNMKGTAQQLYEEGIKLSFEQWGVSGVDVYISNHTDVPEAYEDPMDINSESAPMSTITIAWDEHDDKETKLERIITQKWIANFPLGQEAWADYRRTGYPKLMSVRVNNSGGIVDSDRGARRLIYPDEERINNEKNYEQSLPLLGGADNMATDLWWAKEK